MHTSRSSDGRFPYIDYNHNRPQAWSQLVILQSCFSFFVRPHGHPELLGNYHLLSLACLSSSVSMASLSGLVAALFSSLALLSSSISMANLRFLLATLEDEIPSELAQVVNFYQDDLPHSVMFPTEYRMWIRKWKQHNLSTDTPQKLVDVLKIFSATEFPNIFSLLKLALTLTITSCESERSFSQIKLIKTCIQLTMTDLRQNGLALIKIHLDRCNKIQKSPNKIKDVVQSFRQLHPRG